MTTAQTIQRKSSGASTETVRIIVLDDIAQQGIDLLESISGVEYELRPGLKGEELKAALRDFDGAICRSGVKITAESLEGNTRLKGIARAGVGTDNIDKTMATKLGIVVMNTPAGNTVSTAEHTMALMLGLSRNVAPAFLSLQAGKWDRKSFKGTQLSRKTLGIVGLGRIGQEVACRARAFGMTVLGYDPYLKASQIEPLGIQPCESVDEMLPQVDYLTVHTPLTDETRGLIGKAELKKLKPGVRLINCARGGIYDEAALLEGLESGVIGGVALDVYENEPCTDSPLFQMPHVLCTPHLGASTTEAQIQVAEEAVTLLTNYLLHGEIRHAVNTIAVDPNTLDAIRDYLDIAYRLGIMLSTWHAGAIHRVELQLQGAITNYDRRLVTSAFCAGLLKNVADNANIVNSEVLCEERGIEMVVSTSREHPTFHSVIDAKVSGDGVEREAAATVFGKGMPRLIRVGGYPTDAFMDGILLVFTHRDIPGVIGYVGGVLAKEDVNIAQMAVGRAANQVGGHAIGVLNLDSQATPAAMQRVTDFPGIESVQIICLPEIGEYPEWLS